MLYCPILQRLLTPMCAKRGADPEIITSALRIRKAASAPADAPRDIIAVMKDIAARSAIMSSRELGSVHFQDCTIAIYGDLPITVLAAKRQLAAAARWLQEAAIKYRWGADCSLTVQKGDKTLTLLSTGDQATFLQHLYLPDPDPKCAHNA
ncbi:Hypothetical predicted protein [Pelobates cultripes]|uniref:Uncharacterized protein n=1 Tax=Pelobates cultripes TaxID=61616 RepID=A0AAD1SU31_PELCU|nr:Hypothetical predicted protein [Pelobates cultripes]